MLKSILENGFGFRCKCSFPALIKESATSELLFRNIFRIYAPEFIFEEFEKHRDLVKKKTERTDEEFDKLLLVL